MKSRALPTLKIGNITLDLPLVLGPMAGVTDLPFRVLCKEMGASLTVMEMVSAKGILYHNRNTEAMLRTGEREHPVALQLFGSEPEVMAEAVRMLAGYPFDIIDINMGCPVPKVVKNGEGSALMREPKRAAAIIRAVCSATDKPVTAKIRKGFGKDDETAPEIAKHLEDAGASAIAVHGRTREQYYSGKADWDIIRRTAEAVSIPVIGNGDVDSAEKAEKMLLETGAKGVMIGRAAMGNPWIFREISTFFETGKITPNPTLSEKKELIIRHAKMKADLMGEPAAMREMRSHLIWYTKGLPGASKLRKEAGEISSMDDLYSVLAKWNSHS